MTSRAEELLKSVSRSFYLSLRLLPKALRPPMSTGYLLCRLADTIADASTIPPPERLTWLTEFDRLLKPFPVDAATLEAFATKLADHDFGATGAEALLLKQAHLGFEWFLSLGRTDQVLVQQVVAAVIAGMKMDLEIFGDNAETLRAFSVQAQLEQYIGWIGGEPGRFWSAVTQAHIPSLRVAETLTADGHEFGTGLQMVNILRDINADLAKGRCYIPETRLAAAGLKPVDLLSPSTNERFIPLYHELINETVNRLHHGFRYLELIHSAPLRLRAAVWLPLALGLMTLEKLRENDQPLGKDRSVKVRRAEVYKLLLGSLVLLPSRKLLRMQYDDLKEAALP